MNTFFFEINGKPYAICAGTLHTALKRLGDWAESQQEYNPTKWGSLKIRLIGIRKAAPGWGLRPRVDRT